MILVDDTHCVMTREDFDSLPAYRASLPTGKIIGKRWVTGINDCLMAEYEMCPDDDGFVIVRYRVILFV